MGYFVISKYYVCCLYIMIEAVFLSVIDVEWGLGRI